MEEPSGIIYTDASLKLVCYLLVAPKLEVGILSIADKTVNEAEYFAVLHALARARRLGLKSLTLYSDSQLVIRQLNGKYRIKEPRLQALAQKVRETTKGMQITFIHISREENLAGIVLEGGRKANAVLGKIRSAIS